MRPSQRSELQRHSGPTLRSQWFPELDQLPANGGPQVSPLEVPSEVVEVLRPGFGFVTGSVSYLDGMLSEVLKGCVCC